MPLKRTIYCEIDFLKKFGESIPQALSGREETLQQWLNVFELIKQSELEINTSKLDFGHEAENNEFLKKNLKLFTDKGVKFVEQHSCATVADRFVQKDSDAIVYMLNSASKAEGRVYGQQKGVIVLTSESWESQGYLFADNGCYVEKNDENIQNWGVILKEKYRLFDCHSILIVDKYLLSCKLDYFQDLTKFKKTNIYAIFSALLPKSKPKNPLHISIITEDKNRPELNKEAKLKLDMIKKGIADLRPQCEVEIELLYPHTSPFHDRTIITNNAWISCGAGFDLFNEGQKVSQNTTIQIIYPGMQNCIGWCDEAYEKLKKQASCVIDKIKAKKGGIISSTDKDFSNRIFKNQKDDA